MVRFLQWLFIGHVHKWKTIRENPLHAVNTKETGTRYTQQCEHCGKVVKRDLI